MFEQLPVNVWTIDGDTCSEDSAIEKVIKVKHCWIAQLGGRAWPNKQQS